MKKIIIFALLLTTTILLSACEEQDPCGPGTSLVDNVCVLDDDTTDTPTTPSLVATSCSDETGLHTVAGGKPYTISSWLRWSFIGGHLVTDPDNAWIIDYGAAQFNVHTVPANPWEGSFTTSGMFLTEGCEYTFEFTLRTEASAPKASVIVFGENMSGVSFFEETVPLTTDSKTFRFTVTPETSDYVATGVYFANTTGLVIIEEVQITRDEIGTNE